MGLTNTARELACILLGQHKFMCTWHKKGLEGSAVVAGTLFPSVPLSWSAGQADERGKQQLTAAKQENECMLKYPGLVLLR